MAKPKGSIFHPNKENTIKEVIVDTSEKTELKNHINNKTIHIDQNFIDSIRYTRENIKNHVDNENIHVTEKEKAEWNAKETTKGAQSKVNKILGTLNLHTNNNTLHVTKAEKESFKDKYTKAETRNLIKYSITGLKFLPAVRNRIELNTKYPTPEMNSCVKIKDKQQQLIYNGEKWVEFDGILTPEVTKENDGLMSMDDKKKLDNMEENANNYIHPDNIDTRHVSDTQIEYWNDKADNVLATIFTNGLMSKEDKEKINSIEENANNYIHPETHEPSIILQNENNRFVTDKQIFNWDNKTEKEYVDSVIDNTLSTAKTFVNSKIASIFNTSSDKLEVLNRLAFELKNDDTVQRFFDLFNTCTKNEEFKEHTLNNKIHMSRSDAILLQDVKNLLEDGIIPTWEEIPERPTSLPANGGNADTVCNYTVDDIINKTIDYFDTEIIDPKSTEIDYNNKSILLFGSNNYSIEKELVLRVSNKTFKGNKLSKLKGASIKIIGNNNVIEDLCFTNVKNNIVNGTAITIEGDNNSIRNVSISNYNKGIIVEGSNNNISGNNLFNIRNEAIKLTADNNSNYGNIIDKNRINNSGTGIVLNSCKNLLTKNHITKNNIFGCNIGIVLSNKISDKTKTTLNIISENIVMRGNGKESDYLPTHKTIISEFSSKNIITSNITSGKEIFAINDILSNNIS